MASRIVPSACMFTPLSRKSRLAYYLNIHSEEGEKGMSVFVVQILTLLSRKWLVAGQPATLEVWSTAEGYGTGTQGRGIEHQG